MDNNMTPENPPIKWCWSCSARRQTYRAASDDSSAGALCCNICSYIIVPAVTPDFPAAPPDPWAKPRRLYARLTDYLAHAPGCDINHTDVCTCGLRDLELGKAVDAALAAERQSHAADKQEHAELIGGQIAEAFRAQLAKKDARIEKQRLRIIDRGAEITRLEAEAAEQDVQMVRLLGEHAAEIARLTERNAETERRRDGLDRRLCRILNALGADEHDEGELIARTTRERADAAEFSLRTLQQPITDLLDLMPSFPTYDLRHDAVEAVRVALASSLTRS